MGSVSSTPLSQEYDKDLIREEMRNYASNWSHDGQTELFNAHVPLEPVDFSQTYKDSGLDKIFKTVAQGGKVRTGAGFNCNHLYRSSRDKTDLPIYSTQHYTVLQPLGEPGRDLGEGHAHKIGHFMVISHSSEQKTFNEMLPSTAEEVSDLERRLSVLNGAYANLKENAPVSACGQKVIEKAKELGIDSSVGIREYLCALITKMPDSVRRPASIADGPGYILKNESNQDVGTNQEAVSAMIDQTFGDESLELCKFIQGPKNNSQIMSHIHSFLLTELPDTLKENYLPIDVILEIKKE